MRRILCVSLGVALLPAAGGRADEREAALAILDKAIRAHGGAAALARSQTAVCKRIGQVTVAGKDLVPFSGELITRLPDRLRAAFDIAADGQKLSLVEVLDRDKAWRSVGGVTADLSKDEQQSLLQYLRAEAQFLWMVTLVPLRDRAFGLAPLPEVPVNGKPAVGLKVSRKGQNDVRLYFDKGSGLLARVERRAVESGVPTDKKQVVIDKELVITEHQLFSGVRLPTKYSEFSNGKKIAEIISATYKFPERVDDATFGRP